MKVFLDTSVLVAAVITKHEHHVRAFEILDRVQAGKDQGHISGHSMAEMYSVLTKFPPPFRHTPAQALLSIEENVVKHFKVTALTPGEYAPLIREAALSGIHGGTIYDAVLLKCAAKSGAEKIWAFNLKHFQNIAPKNLASQISEP
ncbi:MAG TPA: PIN domain-containing protein [Verrucomicrobiae bacterium]|nr:PIN domain-containing protein [Verrucomicrobiae bacterium]